MRRSERLKSRRDFAEVYRRGRPYRSSLLIMRTLRTDASHSRFGFAVSRAVGKAVARNQVKRRLREAVRAQTFEPGWDVVLTARANASSASFTQLLGEVAGLFRRAGLVVGASES